MADPTELTRPTRIAVTGAAPYDVVVGHGLLDQLPEVLGDRVERVALIFDSSLAERAQEALRVLNPHYGVLVLGVPKGEAAKTSAVADQCWEALGDEGFTRSDAVVTFGGGATTDLGGFVAATWLRGVRVVHVPTSVLAMVDAAVGGKTGIDTGAGKNLVGAFHEPAGVLCDLDLLDGLPAEELASGLGEVVKCGFIADPEILRLVEDASGDDLRPGARVLRELVERAVRVKVDVVVDDLKEVRGTTGAGHPGREALNYGHTLAHALERLTGYRVRHGEAVAVGAVFVAELARGEGLLGEDVVRRHRAAFARAGLPTSVPELAGADDVDLGFETVRSAMAVDKKARGSQLRFVVLDGLGSPRILAGPDDTALQAAYAAIGGSW
ncbi:3-dehydroquinate synthase [Nocardioides terrisoli]|uniref:3-dehydroquinate synthase n=1 Tax=Nocardioides terrisoli TaxID=3388267 RepID=UPI00287B77CE|nr:3-dehydroquinate synthase [Nocardioides marmorisolisilvae]